MYIRILSTLRCRMEFSSSIDTNITSIRYEIRELHAIYFRYLSMDKENLSRGHGEDRESWTRGMTC